MRFSRAFAFAVASAWCAAGCERPTAPGTVAAQTAASAVDTAASASVASAKPARTPLAPVTGLAGLPNFVKVSDALYRGAQPSEEGFRTLKSMGVKTVVSLRMLHSDRDMLKGTGLRYLRINAKAWHPEDEDVARVLKIVADPTNQPVFVHCEHGADRTGTMVAAYRIVEQGWTPSEAAAELPNFGYHPIWTQVMSYLEGFDRNAMIETVAKTPAPTLDTVD